MKLVFMSLLGLFSAAFLLLPPILAQTAPSSADSLTLSVTPSASTVCQFEPLLLLATLPLTGQTVVSGSVKSGILKVSGVDGKTTELRSETFSVLLKPKTSPVTLILLHSSKQKLFWWTYSAAGIASSDGSAAELLAGSITTLSSSSIVNWRLAPSPLRIVAIESKQHFDSMRTGREYVLSILRNSNDELKRKRSLLTV